MAVADIPFLGAYEEQKHRNQQASAANMNQSIGTLGMLQKIQAMQEQNKVKEILATSPDEVTAMTRLQKEGGTLGIQVAQHIGQLKKQKMEAAQMENEQKVFSPENIARLTTGGQPAKPEISLPPDVAGPVQPAQPAVPGQVDYNALGAQAAATSPKAFETFRAHQASEGQRKAQLALAQQTATQTFFMRMQQANNTINETERKKASDAARAAYQNEILRMKRLETDFWGTGEGQPTPQPAAPVAPQPLPQSSVSPPNMQIPPSVQAERDKVAANVVAREGQPNGGGAIPTSALIPETGQPRAVADVPGVTSPPTQGPTGDEFLSKLPQRLQGEVKKYAEGRMPVPTGFALKSPYFQQLMQAVTQYDPNFSASRYQVRLDFEKGKMRDSRLAFGQSLNHLGTLQSLADAMDNKDLKRMNQVINMVKTETGNPAVTNFQTAQQAVGEELMRAFRQVNASEIETADWKRRFDTINSPAQLKGAIQTAAKLLDGRLHEMNNIWDTSMGTKGGYPNIVSAEARGALDRFLGKGGAASQTERGVSKSGKPMHKENGQWVYD